MLTGSSIIRALEQITTSRRVVLEDISEAIHLMQVSENLGTTVFLIQGKGY